MRISHFFLIVPFLFVAPAYAQDANERIEQLEQEVMLLKRKQERASGVPAPAGENTMGNAQTDVRLTAMEEEMRKLRGAVEEKDFALRRVLEEFEKFKRDAEFRMGEMEKAQTAAAEAAAAQAAAKAAEKQPSTKPTNDKEAKKKAELSVKEVPSKDVGQPAEDKSPKAAVSSPAATVDNPRDHYNYAFRLLNQNQYEEAAKSFTDFTKKYPKDPLVGNAYYWQGETYYIRKEYAGAVNKFRQGFEAMPEGPKAADNLLKLGMSLRALSKNKEACVVLSQVIKKYTASSASVATKAQAEHKRLGCE